MSADATFHLLKKYGLRATDSRLQMLYLFMNHQHTLAYPTLEESLPQFDRATIYRTLNTFLDNKIIHRLSDETGVTQYALSFEEGKPLHENHIHFKCNHCQTTLCLTEIDAPIFELPTGFKTTSVDLLIHGVCNHCGDELAAGKELPAVRACCEHGH